VRTTLDALARPYARGVTLDFSQAPLAKSTASDQGQRCDHGGSRYGRRPVTTRDDASRNRKPSRGNDDYLNSQGRAGQARRERGERRVTWPFGQQAQAFHLTA